MNLLRAGDLRLASVTPLERIADSQKAAALLDSADCYARTGRASPPAEASLAAYTAASDEETEKTGEWWMEKEGKSFGSAQRAASQS